LRSTHGCVRPVSRDPTIHVYKRCNARWRTGISRFGRHPRPCRPAWTHARDHRRGVCLRVISPYSTAHSSRIERVPDRVCPRSGPAPGGGNGGVECAVRTLQGATLLQLNKTAKRGYRADADGAHTSTLRARHSRWNLRVETHSVWRGFDMQRGRESVSLGETRSATRAGCPAPRRVFKSGMVHIAVVHTRGEQCVCPGAVLRSVAVPAHPVGFGTAVEAQPLNLTRVGWGTATAGEGVTTPLSSAARGGR
jgi:hypothetical protein